MRVTSDVIAIYRVEHDPWSGSRGRLVHLAPGEAIIDDDTEIAIDVDLDGVSARFRGRWADVRDRLDRLRVRR